MTPEQEKAEDFARKALQWSMRHQDVHELPLHAQTEERGGMGSENKPEAPSVNLPGVRIDMKVPVWSVAVATFFAIWGGIQMYFKLDDVASKVNQLQMSSEAIRALGSQLSAEQALLKYRMDKLEGVNSK